MLVVSRFVEETCVIKLDTLIPLIEKDPATLAAILSQDIKVLVCGIIEKRKVRLGFDAPKEIGVYRTELLKSMEASR
jgi:carbon storage regulator CsrA